MAGTQGAALLGHLSEIAAVVRTPGSRAVKITPQGAEFLATNFGYDVTEHTAV